MIVNRTLKLLGCVLIVIWIIISVLVYNIVVRVGKLVNEANPSAAVQKFGSVLDAVEEKLKR